jgi:hypothetical protein
MSLQGIVVIDVVALLFIVFVFALLRVGRIYAGYAAMWIGSATAVAILVSTPPLLSTVTSAVGAIFPVSALTLLAFVVIFLVLVLFSVKLTELHERQTTLIQSLALAALEREERGAPSGTEPRL